MRFSSCCVLISAFAGSARVSSAFRPPIHHRRQFAKAEPQRSSTALGASNPTQSAFLTPEAARACVEAAGGTPLYAYSLEQLERSADACLAFPNAYGLTVRYAMKACPNSSILRYFSSRGIHVDASSGYEVRRALAAGIPPSHVSLSSQEMPADFDELVDLGVQLNACSLHQLEAFGRRYEGASQRVGIRINPGVGSGGFSASTTAFSKTNVGGPSSSFGIWHESLPRVKEIVERYGLVVERVHTHIGSGSDPGVWQQVASRTLSFCEAFRDTVAACNLGGGFKVGRNEGEVTTDLQQIGRPVRAAFEDYASRTGKQLRLEIEPGTYLMAMAGALVSTVQDKVSTGSQGHVFLKLDAGMTDVLRPSLYGAIHPITVLPGSGKTDDVGSEQESVVVVGHCCESGDLMTPEPGQPEALAERLVRKASIGDVLVMDGSGAYCSGMSSKNYNSFPEAPEVLLDKSGAAHLIRKRQALEQIYQNEVPVDASVF
jgi:diaminopimelate decarboxylase